jgi:uncharacterized membrane protein YheB (UPF0754 family)
VSAEVLLVPYLQTWSEIRADVGEYWYVYASMPLIAAAIGYVTKLLALEMLYRPLEFVGIGPFGWQGVVPRRAGKVAAVTIELLTENLLKPEELLDRFDPHEVAEELRGPLHEAVEEIAREVVEDYRPGLWDGLPAPARQALVNRVHAQAPQIIDNLMNQMRAQLDAVVDLQFLTVTTLVRNKAQLNDLMRRTGGSAMAFVRRSGVWFGFLIGLVQVLAWATIHNIWIMPVFGFITGFVSDWLALNMLFRPKQRRSFLGISFQGVLQVKREEITRDYAEIMATDLFAPSVLFEAVLTGPGADRLFAMVQREVEAALDQQGGSLVRLTVGTRRYRALKQKISDRVIARMTDSFGEFEEYAARQLAVEELLQDKMNQLSPDEFESIMRPVFKDDEWLMISVGAVLGFLVGELQVEMILHLTG